ncbi:helix-turn-helix transcriptional regulator [Rhizobium sp. KVB221]|uniref:Helix-turn-helix transcriptional regulator n=1 Tax=Rhizobium setariae TaxID=2801340 RepID=A0A936YQU8_9HYPH|nr:helix-turn-helix domain-containing protein [Rhizobium setariae]MBL0370887.1 helix-turn-helix transcriptional regulator [Rhizobium setariae]
MIKSAVQFGARVRAKRRALGWTQAQLAERCGTAERFIVELEGGKPTCQLEQSIVAARVVGIALGDTKTALSPMMVARMIFLGTPRILIALHVYPLA